MKTERYIRRWSWKEPVPKVKQTTVYQVFSVCIHFPLCSREYKGREKCIRVNLTQSLANQVDWGSYYEILLIFVKVSYTVLGWIRGKIWHVNNLIYGMLITHEVQLFLGITSLINGKTSIEASFCSIFILLRKDCGTACWHIKENSCMIEYVNVFHFSKLSLKDCSKTLFDSSYTFYR